MQKTYGNIDSKFKFVIIASKRAKELLRGAKPKVKSKTKSLIRIAQEEVREGLIDYEIVPKKKEEEYKPDEEDFIGEEIEIEKAAEEKEGKKQAEVKEKKKTKGKVSKKKSKES